MLRYTAADVSISSTDASHASAASASVASSFDPNQSLHDAFGSEATHQLLNEILEPSTDVLLAAAATATSTIADGAPVLPSSNSAATSPKAAAPPPPPPQLASDPAAADAEPPGVPPSRRKRGADGDSFSIGSSQLKSSKQIREEEKRLTYISQLGQGERSVSAETKEALQVQREKFVDKLQQPIQSMVLPGLPVPHDLDGACFTHVLVFIDGKQPNLQKLLQPLQSGETQKVFHPNVLFFFVLHPEDTWDFHKELDELKLAKSQQSVLTPAGFFNLRLTSMARSSIKTNAPAKRHLEVRIYNRTALAHDKPTFTFNTGIFGITDSIDVPLLSSTQLVCTASLS